ncbi:MAG: hypothetical protein GY832_44675 [Chloroflexi bacterium]|nr:hypothetical protein [Chloroflexota bacterium]
MNENNIYKIPARNLGPLQKKIEQLARRAAKLGSPDIRMEILKDYEDIENDDGTVTRLYLVSVTGKAPRLNGWRFVAKLQHLDDGTAQGNIVRTVPGESVPERFRTVDPWCDHCNMNRNRKDTFVVTKNDEYKQVGSSCLSDFTGHQSPDAAAQTAEYLIQADELCNEAGNDDWLGGGGRGGPFLIQIETYLAYVSADARLNGWIPRDQMGSTADCALSAMLNQGKNGHTSNLEPIERDWQKAQKALAWAREELATHDRLSDYEWNLVRVCESDVIEASWIGYAASLIPAYTREMNRQAEQESQAKSQHVSTVGQRQHFDELTVTTIIPIDGRYGVTNLHKFRDPAGNVLVWFASNAELEHALTYTGKATVKAHDEYQNVRQTVLTRCKFEAVNGAQQALRVPEIATLDDAVDFLSLQGWSTERSNGSYLLTPPIIGSETQMVAVADVIAKARELCADVC